MKRSSLLSILVTAFLLCFGSSSSFAQKPFRIINDSTNYGLVPGGAFIYAPLTVENLTGDTITIYDGGDINFESVAFTKLLDEMLIVDAENSDSAIFAKMSIPPYETKEFMTVSLFDWEGEETMATSHLARTFWWPDSVAFDDSTWWEMEDSAMAQYWITGQATFTGMGPYYDDFNQEYTLYPNQSIGAPVMFYGPDFLEPANFHFSNLTGAPIVVTDISLWQDRGIAITNISHGQPPFTLGVNEQLDIEVSYVDESVMPIDHLIVQTRSPLDLKKFMLMDPGQFSDVKQSDPKSPKINASIYPNPANESVTLSLDGAQKMNVRIYDIQGVKVFDANATGILTWDRTDAVGQKLSAGAYQVVINGTDNLGKAMTATGQLILQ
jgi:hypothetical protein